MIDRIFLTLFLDDGELPSPYPPMFQENLDSLLRWHPQAQAKVFSLNQARAFIAENFAADVLHALDTLKPHAFKSDLVRYALMYVCGGLYADVGVRWLRPLPVTERTQLLVFKDTPNPTPWAVSQAVIYAEPGRPVFLDAIRRIVANVEARDYGVNALCTTGPNLLGRALAAEGRIADYTFGAHRYLTPGEGLETPAFVVGGEVVALKFKHRHSDISSLGFVGSNNYSELWASRRVFGESWPQWRFFEPQIYCGGAIRESECIAFSPERSGVQTFGPYCRLDPGAYEVCLSFAPPGFTGRLGLDVTADVGQRTLASYQTFAPEDLDAATLRVPLVLETAAAFVEIRTFNDADLAGRLLAIAVEPARA